MLCSLDGCLIPLDGSGSEHKAPCDGRRKGKEKRRSLRPSPAPTKTPLGTGHWLKHCRACRARTQGPSRTQTAETQSSHTQTPSAIFALFAASPPDRRTHPHLTILHTYTHPPLFHLFLLLIHLSTHRRLTPRILFNPRRRLPPSPPPQPHSSPPAPWP